MNKSLMAISNVDAASALALVYGLLGPAPAANALRSNIDPKCLSIEHETPRSPFGHFRPPAEFYQFIASFTGHKT
jgi:hypothetical protein